MLEALHFGYGRLSKVAVDVGTDKYRFRRTIDKYSTILSMTTTDTEEACIGLL